jgi:hypothetical protein
MYMDLIAAIQYFQYWHLFGGILFVRHINTSHLLLFTVSLFAIMDIAQRKTIYKGKLGERLCVCN